MLILILVGCKCSTPGKIAEGWLVVWFGLFGLFVCWLVGWFGLVLFGLVWFGLVGLLVVWLVGLLVCCGGPPFSKKKPSLQVSRSISYAEVEETPNSKTGTGWLKGTAYLEHHPTMGTDNLHV